MTGRPRREDTDEETARVIQADSHYRMPRAMAVPNVGQIVRPPATGSRLWRFLNLFSNSNVWLYRVSGGRIGGRMGRAPVMLLHHVGRKTWRTRVTPVLFMPDAEKLIVVGSKGGAERDPAWVANLMAQPRTTVEVARRRVTVDARMASDSERERYWPDLVAMYPSYFTYQQRTARRLPVVVLEPVT